MSTEIDYLLPEHLTGPRTYFTDLDPQDEDYDEQDVLRKLKLQLLLKKTVVIAASSLFHDLGYRLFIQHPDLIPALEQGILVPALRDQYATPDVFLKSKREYSPASRSFFLAHTRIVVPWSLSEASSWFRRKLLEALQHPDSVLRRGAGITDTEAHDIVLRIEDRIAAEPKDSQFLQRTHIHDVASSLDGTKRAFLESYGHLLYRLLGAYAVRSEGHFPQANLTRLHLTEDEAKLADTRIFWDLYVEAVMSALNSVVQLTPDRLDRLTFKDILVIRKQFFKAGFSDEYDKLIAAAKDDTAIADPERLILRMHEINSAATRLRNDFRVRVFSELAVPNSSERETALWQVVNILVLLAGPLLNLVVGMLSAVKALPEITALASPKLAEGISDRQQWVRQFVNSRIGWSDSQRRTFLDEV
jgi:hypothetical protein